VSEPIGLGRSSHRERLRREVPKPRGSCLGQGPWPVTSRLAALRKKRCHSHVRVTAERSGPWHRLRQWATADEVMRSVGGPWLCSRIVSVAEVDERRAALHIHGRRVRGTVSGSSPRTRERTVGERVSEAGSLVAKPRDRWRVPTNRRKPFRKVGPPGSTHRWKALWVVKVAPP
jgi:hypothetical protein